MSNWYYNKLDGDKKTMEFLYDKCFIKENNKYRFSFNTIKPMPEALNIPYGSMQKSQYIAYITEGFKKQVNEIDPKYLKLTKDLWGEIDQGEIDNAYQECLTYFDKAQLAKIKSTPEDYKRFFGDCQTFDEYIETGHKITQNIETYGTADWFEWRCKNWGSKWDAEECVLSEEQYLEAKRKLSPICFLTADGEPKPFIQVLCKDNPEVEQLEMVTKPEETQQPWSRISYQDNEFSSEEKYGYILYQGADTQTIKIYGCMPHETDSLNPWDYDTLESQREQAREHYEKQDLKALCLDKEENIILAASDMTEVRNICKLLQEGVDIEDEVIPNVEAVVDTESGDIYELDNYQVAKNPRSKSGGKSKGSNAKGKTPNKQYGKQYDVNGVDENKVKRDSLKINAEIACKQQTGATTRRR